MKKINLKSILKKTFNKKLKIKKKKSVNKKKTAKTKKVIKLKIKKSQIIKYTHMNQGFQL